VARSVRFRARMTNTSRHMTSGTDRRAARQLSGEGLTFRLSDEIQELRRDITRASGQRSAKTLAKAGGLRATLVYLEANATMSPESDAGGASIQVIEGRLRVQIDGMIHELGPGELMILEQNLREPIQAAERSAFLVTVHWPEGAGAWSQEQAQGRH
jgi:quercetin dioxygenase-like cupin family protein